MKLDLTPAQVRLLDTLLGLDLEAIGLGAAQQRTAHAIHVKVLEGDGHGVKAAEGVIGLGPREITTHDPFRVLRLTPSYRKDK